jgi:hypothetical protein
MSSITPVDTTTVVPYTLSRRFRKPATAHATTSLRVVSGDICAARNRPRLDWSSAPGTSRQQLSSRGSVSRLGEKRDVVWFNKTHDPDAEVKFRELEHAFETQAFQDRLILGGAGLADALFEIHAGAAHVLQGGNLFFGVEAVHHTRCAVSDETQSIR